MHCFGPTVVPRYADVVESWDVVNEVIDAAAPGGLRVSPWLEIIGPDYIDWAFVYAAEVAGDAFRSVWSGDKLHIVVEVDDSTRDRSGDTIDVFIGGNKYSFRGFGRTRPDGAEGFILPRRGGYRLKAALPAGRELVEGGTIAFDIRVSDASTGSQLSWSNTRHNQEVDATKAGTLTLIPRKKIVPVLRGAPVIDGVEDRVWRRAQPFKTKTFVLGSSGATARVRTLWDDGRIHLYVEVQDPLLSVANPNRWQQDSIEIFIDANNAQTTSYQGDDAQYRVNYLNEQSFGGAASASRIVSATRIVPGGYVVEASIAVDGLDGEAGRGWHCDPSYVGFDIQVNDDGAGDGVRSSVATWNDTTGRAFQDTSRFGALQLLPIGR